eukprot:SAG25_NODE_184_length_12440_cov_76.528968_10_plen_119_part_00
MDFTRENLTIPSIQRADLTLHRGKSVNFRTKSHPRLFLKMALRDLLSLATVADYYSCDGTGRGSTPTGSDTSGRRRPSAASNWGHRIADAAFVVAATVQIKGHPILQILADGYTDYYS